MDYTLEIEINLRREKVVELFDSQDNLGAWQPGFVRLEHKSGEPGKAGAVSVLKYKNRGRDVELTETITVNNLPDEFSATFVAKGMKIAVENRFHEAGPEKTKWVSVNKGEVSGFMMRLFALIMPGCFRKESFKYMENFKAWVEDGVDLRNEG